MSRLLRRNRTYVELGLLSSGGVMDAFDNAIKECYRLTDNEYDYIAEKLTDEEGEYILCMEPSFSDKRKIIEILNKYFNEMDSNK